MIHLTKSLTLVLAACAIALTCQAQTEDGAHVTKTYFVDNFFKAECEYLVSDTTVKDGSYKLYHHGKVIEEGAYSHGKKTGEWKFWNLYKEIELKYDFTLKQPTYVLPHVGHSYDQKNNPPIFIGSPLVPFYFITNRVYFPKSEGMKNKSGKVVLSLKIDTKGKVESVTIKKATNDAFASVVRKAANQIPKNKWRWYPAQRAGKRVAGDYDITIVFEND